MVSQVTDSVRELLEWLTVAKIAIVVGVVYLLFILPNRILLWLIGEE